VKALIDTNILIDCAGGVKHAVQELDRYQELAVSRIVWIEFLVGAKTSVMEASRKSLVEEFELLEIDAAVSLETIIIRQRTRLRLPDAIILATARVHGLLLVTTNHRDFSRRDPNVRIPY
jgi:predicted nucleic acid-binding protein